ncbi:type IV pilus assembly protein PilX [Variovorax paradoxus]|uniref:pilus assembly PilX family protein n=1 Tax=Variovorax paradoxus TaxID=34073 RepID=UPI0027833A4C|nr:PilX N-terminal domain-containing pilus assembly protein [Variovorax paradoxus]MDP9965965.1 type IV pilus assembly protein PilX [Variovorax paradoxus]
MTYPAHNFMALCPAPRIRERGASLIVVMLILIIVSILGVGGAQIATMAERGSRNDRDIQVAWQAAEAALMDAEFDIHGPGTASRKAVFTDMHNTNDFVAGCGASGNSRGLCALVETGKPAWLVANFTDDATNAKTVPFGLFTGRTFAAGTTGIQPAKVPRYIIEPIPDPLNRDKTFEKPPTYIYRVTAMGFGPRDDIQAVAQILYRD